MAHCLRRMKRAAVEQADLIPGALIQAPLISPLASLGAEPHAPIAPGAKAEFSAAMVAVQGHEPRVHALGEGARNPIAAVELLKATL